MSRDGGSETEETSASRLVWRFKGFISCETRLIITTDPFGGPQFFLSVFTPTYPSTPPTMSSQSRLTYAARATNHPNPLARKLFEVAEAKKSNVTVSADVTTTKELLDLADRE